MQYNKKPNYDFYIHHYNIAKPGQKTIIFQESSS
jgi:hypothetical protein